MGNPFEYQQGYVIWPEPFLYNQQGGYSGYHVWLTAQPPQEPQEPDGGAGVGAKLPTIPPSLVGAAANVIPQDVPSGE
jgi:hypothetical protein